VSSWTKERGRGSIRQRERERERERECVCVRERHGDRERQNNLEYRKILINLKNTVQIREAFHVLSGFGPG
jgi:hypothetical protein